MISADFPYTKEYRTVLGYKMAYVDSGVGDPIVLLHGNPTSSYLWRNIIPYLEPFGRCIVPDLIGMGDSQKLTVSGNESYQFVEHRRYLDELLRQLDIAERVTLVVHDWGSALGFDWANRHREAVKAIVYMEAIVKPLSWSDWPSQTQELFRALRSPAGDNMILEQNMFVETMLPYMIMRTLDDVEMQKYRRPFVEAGEDRRPTLSWPRQLPLDGEPADVTEIVTAYSDWLAHSQVPKLFINADPGTMQPGLREFCRTWLVQTEVTVAGRHFIQEDSPHEIGRAIETWMRNL